jgi:eukaryotic translation initiation factor 2C
VPARLLPPPIVQYANSLASASEVANGSWNLRDRQFNVTKVVKMKSYAFLTWKGKFRVDKNAAAELASQLSGLGVVERNVAYKIHELASDPWANPDGWEREARAKLHTVAKEDHGFVLVVLPSGNKNHTEVYNAVKAICDVELGLINICVLGGNLNNKTGNQLSEFCANISMKVNMKLRGINHLVNYRNFRGLEDTLMIGLDVTHPSPGSASTAPSVAAIVGSIDHRFAQFPGALDVLPGSTEISRDDTGLARLQNLFSGRLKLWSANNSRKIPKKILVFRDGVSEGQYPQLLQYELPQLKAACEDLCRATGDKGYKQMPKITIFVVGKRHNTRFYPPKNIDSEFISNSGNPKPCTVVDRGITEALTWDFYLLGQHAIQGTARPAHYVVVHDEIFTPLKNSGINIADEVQQIILATHFSMGRATKSVSYCAPAYYADLFAERGRKYLWKEFAPKNVSDTASITSGGRGKESEAARIQRIAAYIDTLRKNVMLHPNVRDSMVYI